MACRNCGTMPTYRDGSELLSDSGSSPIDLNHLLSTNDSPSDIETSSIRDFLTKGRIRLAALNSQVDMLRGALDRLIAERAGISTQLDRYQTILSPVRLFPPEILCEIFFWTLPITDEEETPEQAPWYLGHISRPWRAVSLGFPLLWNVFAIPNCRSEHSLVKLQTQLTRSANAPLDIHLTFLVEPLDTAPLLSVLLSHSNRWESLYAQCIEPFYTAMLHLLHPASGRLAQLKRLKFHVLGGPHDLMATDLFRMAPRLREVMLSDTSIADFSPPLLLPWGQITRYRGDAPRADTLQSAANLVEAALGFLGREQEGTIITLPLLLRLYVEQPGLLAHLTAPKLEYLSCDTVDDDVLSFTLRSSCQLTTLVLTLGSMSNWPFTLPPDDIISLS
ncbi:hypothetical protein C8R47DRAFT_1327146 [Mycena vitilis]|nr:hypothetical protein C8R47DRAFT_1327146 [Mycena vitilis]